LTARIDENANAIDLIFSAKGLNATDKAQSVAKLVFAENCIDAGSPTYNDEKELNW